MNIALSRSAITPLSSEPAIGLRRLARLAGWWALSKGEQAALVGRAEAAPSLRLRRVGQDMVALIERLDAVHRASRRAGFGPEWLRQGSNRFGGRTPLEMMADGEAETVLRALETAL